MLQILHSEQVLGYPHQLALGLQCELFGMAGYYSLHLRAGRPSLVAWPVDAGANATIKVLPRHCILILYRRSLQTQRSPCHGALA